jgi:hypothetical protein
MKNSISLNQKQLIKSINYDVESFSNSLNQALKYAISAGENLIKLKELTPHGQWESRLKTDFQDRFGDRQARRFMEIARNKTLAIELNKDEALTLEGTIKAISDATPEQLERVKQIEAERLAAEEQAKADRAAKAAELEAKKAEEQIIEQVQTKEPEIIEGEFVEVIEPEETLEQVLTEANEILQADNQELVKEIDSVTKILESNDQVAAALAEAKKYRELNRVLNERITGLQNERNELIKSVKYWKNRAEKLEKAAA